MPALRDFIGSTCPRCAGDILQPAPSTNRMPGEALAWCPACRATMSLAELQSRPRATFWGKLFGRAQRS
jgi:hypothetical protein